MLVLSGKNDQSVDIGGSDHVGHKLKVAVLEIGRGSVRLGLAAGNDPPVHRAEVWERIRANGRPDPLAAIPPAPNEELDRWADDGGGPGIPDGRPGGAPRKTGGHTHVENTKAQDYGVCRFRSETERNMGTKAMAALLRVQQEFLPRRRPGP